MVCILHFMTSGFSSNNCKTVTRSQDSSESSQHSVPSLLNVYDADVYDREWVYLQCDKKTSKASSRSQHKNQSREGVFTTVSQPGGNASLRSKHPLYPVGNDVLE